jgi:glycosyltransferase involved in cell wall biosynthesis
MKISVVIPAYNEEKYIRKCLSSLLNQNFKGDFEIVVCLNTCTDKTEEVIKRMEALNNVKIRIVKEERKGVSRARQRGTKEALGEIIASADADTEYQTNWLNRAAFEFEKFPKIVALYGPVFIKNGGIGLKILSKYFYTAFLYLSKLLGKDNVAGMNFVFRKDFFDKIGGYNVNLKSAEDIDLAKRLKKFGKIKFNRNLIVYTSSRRFEGKFFKSFVHHTKNYLNTFWFKKTPEDFEDIR